MKKIFLLLLLTIAVNVSAKENYTDYEFIEYIQEQHENDELNKYEPVFLNNFYKLVESEPEYLEEDLDNKYEFKDETDFKFETVTSSTKSPIYENEGQVTFGADYDYLLNSIEFKNIKNFDKIDIREIEVYDSDRKVSFEVVGYNSLTDGDLKTPVELTSNSLTIKLAFQNWLSALKIVIYYGNDVPINFDIKPNKRSGLYTLEKNITLDNTVNKTTLNFMEMNNFNYHTSVFHLPVEDNISKYYSFKKKIYKHYNIEKSYYIQSELKEIEGYTYDEEESVKMYKHYQREKYETPDEIEPENKQPNDEDSKQETPSSNDETTNTNINNVIPELPSKTEPSHIEKEELSQSVTPKTETLNKSKKTFKVLTTKDTSENEIDNNTLPKKELIDEIIQDDKEINTLSKQDPESGTCECNPKPSIWFIISTILIIISLIFNCLHLKDVKKKK